MGGRGNVFKVTPAECADVPAEFVAAIRKTVWVKLDERPLIVAVLPITLTAVFGNDVFVE